MRYGEPDDVVGQCNAHLYVGDNCGDNHATMRCQLENGHEGNHRDTFRDGKAWTEWQENERRQEDESDE